MQVRARQEDRMTRPTWLTILLVVIGACVAFAVYTRIHPAGLPNFHR